MRPSFGRLLLKVHQFFFLFLFLHYIMHDLMSFPIIYCGIVVYSVSENSTKNYLARVTLRVLKGSQNSLSIKICLSVRRARQEAFLLLAHGPHTQDTRSQLFSVKTFHIGLAYLVSFHAVFFASSWQDFCYFLPSFRCIGGISSQSLL